MVAVLAIEPLSIRPWRPGDEHLMREAEGLISPGTIAARFFGGGHTLPTTYLRHVATAYPRWWNAVVAISGGRLVGWAEFGTYAGEEHVGDLGVLVVDAWQHQGIGPALVEALLPLARHAGITVLRAEVLSGNQPARRALERLSGGRLRPSYDGGVLSYALPTRAGWLTAGSAMVRELQPVTGRRAGHRRN